MTMHDDPSLELLERDLQRLAEPRAEDELVRLAIRSQLADRSAPPELAAPRPRRQRRRPARIVLGAAAVVAAATATAVVTDVVTSGSGGPAVANAAVIHHALAAVSGPANTIIHEKIVGDQNGVPVEAEWWQQTGSPYANRVIKGPVGHEGEISDDGTHSFQYDAATNTITEQRDSSAPTLIDPVSQVRQELASGQAQVEGTVVIGGTSLYKIALPHGLVGYFDTTDYRPRYVDDPQRDGSVVREQVTTYYYLPLTAASQALLSVTAQHPTARIVTSASPSRQERVTPDFSSAARSPKLRHGSGRG